MIIDSHVHVCPHEMHAKAIRDWFERNAWFEICYGDDAPRSVIKSLDKYDVDKAVILAFNWARSHHAKAPPNEYVAKLAKNILNILYFFGYRRTLNKLSKCS